MQRFHILVAIMLAGCAPPQVTKSLDGIEAISVARDTTPPRVEFKTDEQQVADAVLRCLLTSAEAKKPCDFYGTSGAREICLQSGNTKWPGTDFSAIAGYQVHPGRVQDAEDRDRVLGVRLERLSIEPISTSTNNFSIQTNSHIPEATADVELSLFNAGGQKNGGVIGGCTMSIKATLTEHGWQAEVVSWFDP